MRADSLLENEAQGAPGRVRHVQARLSLDLMRQVLDLAPIRCQAVVLSQSDFIVRLWRRDGVRHELGSDAMPTIAFSVFPLGDRVVLWSESGTGVIWDTASGVAVQELRNSEAVRCARVFPSGDRVFACGGHSCRIWRADSGTALSARQPFEINGIDVLPSGDLVVGYGREAWAPIWDTRTGEVVCELRGHSGAIVAAAAFPRGRRVLTVAAGERRALVWSASSCAVLQELRLREDPLQALVVAGGASAAILDGRGRVALRSLGGSLGEATFGAPEAWDFGFLGLEAVPRGDHVAGWSTGGLVVWDAQSQEEVLRASARTSSLAAALDGDTLFACGPEGLVAWSLSKRSAIPVGSGDCLLVVAGLTSALDPQGLGGGTSWRELP